MTTIQEPSSDGARKSASLPSGCWEWQAAIAKQTGYGVFTVRTRVHVSAHRFAREIAHGAIPAGRAFCHRCGTGAASTLSIFSSARRPTTFDTRCSAVDAKASRGRRGGQAYPQRCDLSLVLRGEKHGMAKLTADAVRAIRGTDVSARGSRARLARAYGISTLT